MTGELSEIAAIAVTALSCGLLFEKMRQPAVLGYILAGIILSLFGLIEDRHHIEALAEMGVQMLLFLIGLELSLKSFKEVWHITLVTTLLQISGALTCVLGLGQLLGWPFGLSLIIAFSIALSSTAVAIKMLESIDELNTKAGRLAVGVLIAQDLAIVPIILLIRGLSGGTFQTAILIKIFISVALLVAMIWFFTRDREIRLPYSKTIERNPDLTPLAALVFCFGCALISGLIGLSAAYGAFLGGLILGNTTERHTMVNATKPIQSVLMMVFFLSVGLLMDISYIIQNFGKVLLLLSFITVGKTFLNISIFNLLKISKQNAFLTGLVLAQMGEFSFVLVTVGTSEGLLDADGSKLIISLAALSLAISPLWLTGARRIHELQTRRLKSFRQLTFLIYGKQIEIISHGIEIFMVVTTPLFTWIKGQIHKYSSRKKPPVDKS